MSPIKKRSKETTSESINSAENNRNEKDAPESKSKNKENSEVSIKGAVKNSSECKSQSYSTLKEDDKTLNKIVDNMEILIMETKEIHKENAKLRNEIEHFAASLNLEKSEWKKDKLDLIKRLEVLEEKLTDHLEKKVGCGVKSTGKGERSCSSITTRSVDEPENSEQQLYYIRNLYWEMKRISQVQTTILTLLFTMVDGDSCQKY